MFLKSKYVCLVIAVIFSRSFFSQQMIDCDIYTIFAGPPQTARNFSQQIQAQSIHTTFKVDSPFAEWATQIVWGKMKVKL